MAVIARPEVDRPPTVKVPMRPYLAGLHDQWREEVRRVLDPARE